MPFPVNDPKRVSQSRYWISFGINIVAVTFLLVGGIFAVFSGEFAIGVLMILATLPVGLWFRVVMMRRCRDIGWPASLPWITFGVGIVANFMNFGAVGAADAASAALALPLLAGLADLVLMIVIGCVGSQSAGADYREVFGGAPAVSDAAISRASPQDYLGDHETADDESARWDAAIARALEGRAGGGAAQGAPHVPAQPGPARPAGGFGRRAV